MTTRPTAASSVPHGSIPPFGPIRPDPTPGAQPGVAPSWFQEHDPAAEVRERLLDRRVVLAHGFLDDALATRIAAELMYLDGTGDDPIELHLGCADGELSASNALADTVDLVGVRVVARGRGTIGGPALAPFTAADHRIATPFSLFQLRDPSVESTGSADALAAFAQRHGHEVDALHRRIARATGRSTEEVAADFRTGTILDADQARRAGIVHEVQRPGPAPVTDLHDRR
jgi:ATP-dependent Clp protease protease subunit